MMAVMMMTMMGVIFFSFCDRDDQTFNNEDEPTEMDANDQTLNVDVAAS